MRCILGVPPVAIRPGAVEEAPKSGAGRMYERI